MEQFATSLSDPATLLSLVVAVAMFMTIVGVMLPALKGDKLETRLKQVSSQREKLRRANRAQLEQKGIKREAKGTISEITKKLDLQTSRLDNFAAGCSCRPKPMTAQGFGMLSSPVDHLLLLLIMRD